MIVSVQYGFCGDELTSLTAQHGEMSDEEDRLDFGEDDDSESVISLGADTQQPSQQEDALSEVVEPSAAAAPDTQAEEVSVEAPAVPDDTSSAVESRSATVKLPAGWVECKSKSSGEVYYLNTVDKSTTWDIPQYLASAVAPTSVSSQNDANPDQKFDHDLSAKLSAHLQPAQSCTFDSFTMQTGRPVASSIRVNIRPVFVHFLDFFNATRLSAQCSDVTRATVR